MQWKGVKVNWSDLYILRDASDEDVDVYEDDESRILKGQLWFIQINSYSINHE